MAPEQAGEEHEETAIGPEANVALVIKGIIKGIDKLLRGAGMGGEKRRSKKKEFWRMKEKRKMPEEEEVEYELGLAYTEGLAIYAYTYIYTNERARTRARTHRPGHWRAILDVSSSKTGQVSQAGRLYLPQKAKESHLWMRMCSSCSSLRRRSLKQLPFCCG
jgi:hypothetical protein